MPCCDSDLLELSMIVTKTIYNDNLYRYFEVLKIYSKLECYSYAHFEKIERSFCVEFRLE